MKHLYAVILCVLFAFQAIANDVEVSAKKTERLIWNSLSSNLIGKLPADVDVELKARGLDWQVESGRCSSPQQGACKERYLEYCRCISFADTIREKPLEAKTYTAVVRDEKIVDYKMESSLLPANVWFEKDDKVAHLRVSTFSGGVKPYNVHFDEIIPFGDKVPSLKTRVGQFIAQWSKDGVEIAATIWCPMVDRKGMVGKIRDCFVHEATFSTIRQFKIPKGVNKYEY